MEYVLALNFGFFAFLSVVCLGDTWPKLLIKFGMISLTVLNGVAAFQQFGFIVKV